VYRTLLVAPHMCAFFEEPLNPGKPDNGVIKPLKIGEGLEVAVYLHLKCVEQWERKCALKSGDKSD
jgi:hypothetical protein